MARHAHEDALSDTGVKELIGRANLLQPPWNQSAVQALSLNIITQSERPKDPLLNA